MQKELATGITAYYEGKEYRVSSFTGREPQDRVVLIDAENNKVHCDVSMISLTRPAPADAKYAVGGTVKYCENQYKVISVMSRLSNRDAVYTLERLRDGHIQASVPESIIFEWTIKDDARIYLDAEEDAVNARISEAKLEVVRLNNQINEDLRKLENIAAARHLF